MRQNERRMLLTAVCLFSLCVLLCLSSAHLMTHRDGEGHCDLCEFLCGGSYRVTLATLSFALLLPLCVRGTASSECCLFDFFNPVALHDKLTD